MTVTPNTTLTTLGLLMWHYFVIIPADIVSVREYKDVWFPTSLIRCRSKKTSKFRVTGLCAEIHRSRTKGQWRGKYFHLMTSSWANEVYICNANVCVWVNTCFAILWSVHFCFHQCSFRIMSILMQGINWVLPYRPTIHSLLWYKHQNYILTHTSVVT